ncbi:MAG: hypothetical protein PVH29_06725 [Candidatus Zixiibacteriota bacterium]|jgi:hypothetical protein
MPIRKAGATRAGRNFLSAVGAWFGGGAGFDGALVVLFAVLAYRAAYGLVAFDSIAVPVFDFFGFRDLAESFSRLELPAFFKRGPGYPFLMALWPFSFGGADRLLQGGEVVSYLAGVGTLVFLYRWTRPRFGRAAVLVVATAAGFATFVEHTIQPLCDVTLAFFVTAAAAEAGKGKGWAYVAAAFAAATRYEAAVLIPLVALADYKHWRGRRRLIAYAALAAVPVGAWLALSIVHSEVVNPYVEQMLALQPVGTAFLDVTAYAVFTPWVPHLVFVKYIFCAAAVAGIIVAVIRGGAGARVYAGFAACYVVIHMLFPFAFDRFVVPLIPLLAVGLVAAGQEIVRWAGRWNRGWVWLAAGVPAVAVWASGVFTSFTARREEPALLVWGAALPLLILTVAAAGAAFFRRGVPRREVAGRLGAAFVAVAILSFFVNGQMRFWESRWYSYRYGGSTIRTAGEVLGKVARPDDTVCSAWGEVLLYYARPTSFHTMLPRNMRPVKTRFFPGKAARRGVNYICYDSISAADADTYFGSITGAGLLARFAEGRNVPPYEHWVTLRRGWEYAHLYRRRPGWKPKSDGNASEKGIEGNEFSEGTEGETPGQE